MAEPEEDFEKLASHSSEEDIHPPSTSDPSYSGTGPSPVINNVSKCFCPPHGKYVRNDKITSTQT